MLIHGKERKFKLTVGASVAISEMCPGKELKRLGEILQGTYIETLDVIMRLIIEMNRGHEESRKFEEPGYAPDVITLEELMAVDMRDVQALQAEALIAFNRDAEPTVETEEAKKKENAAEA